MGDTRLPFAGQQGTTLDSLKAVLFDLDDTLYDHLHSVEQGLVTLREHYPLLCSVALGELERRYCAALERLHTQLLQGELTQQESRTRRMQSVFSTFGVELDAKQAWAAFEVFRRGYASAQRCVAGSQRLLESLRQAGLRMAIVSNNLVSEQIPKLKRLGIHEYFEVISISEEVGVAKPEARIFHVTLDRLGLSHREVVMVGDSLDSDIAGAQALDIRSVWLNRRPSIVTDRPRDVAIVERDFTDHDHALACVLS